VATEHFTIGGAKNLATSLNIIKLQTEITAICNEDVLYDLVVASVKLREEVLASSYRSARLSIANSAPTGQIFIKYGI